MSIQAERPLGARHFHGFGDVPGELEADACIIGSGASGAVAADALRDCGWSVIMVEEGSLLRRDVSQEEVDDASPAAEVRGEQGWEDKGWPWSTRNVGGGTLFYGGASFRFPDCDFDASSWLPGHGLEVAWPIGPADLAPYYELIERRIGVSGGRPDEPAGGRGSPLPMTLPAERMSAAAKRLGYAPFPTPVAVNGGACNLEKRCIDYQCPNGAKGDVVRVYLKKLADDPDFLLLSGIRGVALEQDTADRAAALRCLDLASGVTRRVRARHFFVAGNAIQSAALLLRSVTPFAPEGIGNRHDLVGRGLCMKLSQYVRGMTEVPPDADRHPVGLRGPFSTLAILDHYLDAGCPTGMGGLIYEARSLTLPPGPVRQLPMELETIIADTPSYHNRVRLSGNRDAWGMPKIVIDYRVDPVDLARLAYMAGRCERILREAGVDEVKSKRARSEHGSTHLHGTCRSGTDPARSVLDPHCRVHDLENVHVVDGSFMPFPGGLNPTLTIQANALRVALHVAGAC
ncbi:GMC oxidoreductase [Paludibacterium paludis]|uniref:GMC family oxidoreductase n=1 Tax=Paludibacterium paludis TaxID=1225769 RepID=A0A918P678_9NEIS|nr:GMC family oxidoreductase [Paludibacterium paludis]GGY24574.1 GMC family oxidoreductase [Paludibacterium paludis]